MKPSRLRLVAALMIAAAFVAVWLTNRKLAAIPKAENEISQRTRATPPDIEQEREVSDKAARRKMEDDWNVLLQWLRSEPIPSPDEVRKRLLALRIEWTAIDPQVRAEMIALLLESGADAATGLDFKVGNHGQLAGWPTLRTFLLDVLATADPEMSPDIARRVLDRTDSADEFATGLRSLTRENMGRADDGELLERFGKLLGRTEWRQSRAFAEAFDLARFVGTPEAARLLADWQGNSALKTMAMGEFAAEHPAAMLKVLQDNATPLDAATHASLMARMDPADAAQLAAVDSYLRDPARTPEEAAAFLKTYPLRSATTGFRLYGKTPSPYTFDRIAAGDRMAEKQVVQWLADPALEKFKPGLTTSHQRLKQWVDEAK
jgi:hypothetical protein